MLLYPSQEARDNLCVAFEACIHVLEGAKVPIITCGWLKIFSYQSDFGGICTNQWALVGKDLSIETPSGVSSVQWFHVFILSHFITWCSYILSRNLRGACVLHLKLIFMLQEVPKSSMITWGWLKFFLVQSEFGGICTNQWALVGRGVLTPKPLQGSIGACGFTFFYYQIFSL